VITVAVVVLLQSLKLLKNAADAVTIVVAMIPNS